MRLSRENMTRPSRIMLPTYTVLFIGVGLSYLLTPIERLDRTPGLAYADDVAGIRTWALLFLAIGVVMASALIAQRRSLYRFALIGAVITLGLWSLVFLFAAIDGTASPGGFMWPAAITAACAASYRSISDGEGAP